MLRGSVPTVNSHAQHVFSRAPQVSVPRSAFNRSFNCKTTFNEGFLVPIFADEMVPGDTFRLKMHAFARLSTLLFPIMDNLYFETFFFFVPNRLLWDNWQKFCGEQTNPGDSVDYVVPHFTSPVDGFPEGSLVDYFGLPTKTSAYTFNALHFRAYNLIWNEWFRSQDLQDSLVVDLGDSAGSLSNYVLRRRNKRYDYFTSCLPFPQKGPDVSLPLGTFAPVVGVSGEYPSFKAGTGLPDQHIIANASSQLGTELPGVGIFSWSSTALRTDLTSATAADINDIRIAFQLQRFYEKQARGGTRYIEVIKSHFGVVSPDMRLQRPEYIGGGSTPILVTPVAQTATLGADPLAKLGAFGTVAPESHGFTYSATEHGVLLGLASVRADLNYQSGIDRMWSRRTFADYYWPVFSHLGEQAVLNQEIFAQGTAADQAVFGFQERYAEYRYKPSLITGLFRSNATGTLDAWHLAQSFASLPPLNSSFIEENAPMARVKAVTTGPDFLFDGFFSYHCVRPMPVYSIPGLVDHF